jgi:hypothetical protein
MKKVFFTILGMLIFCVLFAQEIPQKISYQGKLLEDETPVTGTKSITFTIDTWTELHPNVPVTKGLYSVTLGKTTPIPTHIFDNSTSVTLQISVEGTFLMLTKPKNRLMLKMRKLLVEMLFQQLHQVQIKY